jgi:hypothetical protein
MSTKVITSHTTQSRDSWWYLVQEEDGTLWVKYKSDQQGEKVEATHSINDFLKKGGPGKAELQKLIERMFK